MKVLIILGTNDEGKKEAVEEDFSSWQEAIDRSPVGEFVVRYGIVDYIFFKKSNELCCEAYDFEGAEFGFYEGSEAKEKFDQLLASSL